MMKVILAFFAMLLLASALYAADPLDFPRREWIAEQIRQVNERAEAEMAKPRAQWSRGTLTELAQWGEALNILAEQNAGRPLPRARIEAKEGLRILDAEDAAKAAKEAATAEKAATKTRKLAADKKQAAERAAWLDAIVKSGANAEQTDAIMRRGVLIGMSTEQARLSWGEPTSRSRYTTASGVTEHWHYHGGSLMFVNGKLAVIGN